LKFIQGRRCPKCNASHGELKIKKILDINNVKNIIEYTFIDCKNIRPLPFDFYLPDLNMCIEYQGMQHYEPGDFFGGIEEFEKRQLRDSIKEKYCIDNNIN